MEVGIPRPAVAGEAFVLRLWTPDRPAVTPAERACPGPVCLCRAGVARNAA